MKNKLFIFFAATALMASFAACSNDTEEGGAGTSAIQFTGVVNSNATRATDALQPTSLTVGAKVGLFADSDLADNAILTATTSSVLTPTGELKWPATGDINFYAYSPYDEANAGKISSSIDFTVKADQTSDDNYIASDLLWGVPATNPVSNGQKVNLVFDHKLAKVIIKLSAEEASGVTLKSPTVNLLSVVNAVAVNVKNGEVEPTTASTGNIAVHQFGDEATSFSCAAIIAPQTIQAGVDFIQVINDGVTYNCSLSSSKTLESKGAYVFNVKFETSKVTVELEGSVHDWNVEEGDGTDTNHKEVVTYTVGDYVLADGSFVKKAEIGSESPVGVIFSTTVSEEDAKAGYTAYILGLYEMGTKAPLTSEASLPYDAIKNYPESLADLDGLSHTQTVLAKENGLTTYPFFDLSTDKNGSALATLDQSNFSQWFVPSIGQMYQILANLGGATIPTTTSTAQKYYGCIPNITSNNEKVTSNSDGTKAIELKGYKTIINSTITSTQIKSNLAASTNNQSPFTSDIVAVADYADASNVFVIRFDKLEGGNITDDERVGAWGSTALGATSARARVACIATKSTSIVAPTTTAE